MAGMYIKRDGSIDFPHPIQAQTSTTLSWQSESYQVNGPKINHSDCAPAVLGVVELTKLRVYQDDNASSRNVPGKYVQIVLLKYKYGRTEISFQISVGHFFFSLF